MENLVRELRVAVGSQQKLADLLGCAVSSIQGWEGRRVSQQMLLRMADVALDRSLGDLAMQFKKLAESTETGSEGSSSPFPAFKHQRWHEILDVVLDSRNVKAISAVQSNLVLFHDYLAVVSPKLVPDQSPKDSKKKLPKVG